MLSSKLKGALHLVTNILFYSKDGKLSLVKCALFAGAAYYFAFINPIMLAAILELTVIFFVFYTLWRVILAAWDGGLEAYGEQA